MCLSDVYRWTFILYFTNADTTTASGLMVCLPAMGALRLQMERFILVATNMAR